MSMPPSPPDSAWADFGGVGVVTPNVYASFAAHMRAQGHATYTDEYVERMHRSIDAAEVAEKARKAKK